MMTLKSSWEVVIYKPPTKDEGLYLLQAHEAVDMVARQISFFLVLLGAVVVTESFAVVRFWRQEENQLEENGKIQMPFHFLYCKYWLKKHYSISIPFTPITF